MKNKSLEFAKGMLDAHKFIEDVGTMDAGYYCYYVSSCLLNKKWVCGISSCDKCKWRRLDNMNNVMELYK